MTTDPARLTDEPIDERDTAAMETLLRTLGVLDPAPPDLVAQVEFTLSLASLDAELAKLQDEALAIRADVEVAESVTFAASTVTLMVVIGREDDAVRIDAWVSGGGMTVELMQPAARLTAVSDVNGRLSWPRVHPGRTQFLVHAMTPGARAVITPPIEV